MQDITNQIPSYDIIRKFTESRYYVVDANMKGTFRFGYGVSNNEAVFKSGTSVKCSSSSLVGENSVNIDNELIGVSKNSYIKIGRHFYLVHYIEDKEIFIYGTLEEDVNEGEVIKLYSVPVEIGKNGVFTKFEFKVGVIVIVGYKSYTIKEDDSVEDVVKFLSKYTLAHNFGNTIYALGEVSTSDSNYIIYGEFTIESGFLEVNSPCFICSGDDLVLFNEDVRASNIVRVVGTKQEDAVYGYRYIVMVNGLSGDFQYAQLRAYPAYISNRLDIHNCKPSIVDLCEGTVYGSDIEVVKGVKLLSNDTELTNGFEDIEYIANLPTEPADLWLCEALEGKIEPNLPSITMVPNDEGIFRMYVDSKIDETFVLRFSSSYADTIITVLDVDGNVICKGGVNESLETSLNKVTINIKSLQGINTTLSSFNCNKERTTHIEYYFVSREQSNERVEVNSLHLNPVFRNYRELLAIIGRDKTNEGRIAL